MLEEKDAGMSGIVGLWKGKRGKGRGEREGRGGERSGKRWLWKEGGEGGEGRICVSYFLFPLPQSLIVGKGKGDVAYLVMNLNIPLLLSVTASLPLPWFYTASPRLRNLDHSSSQHALFIRKRRSTSAVSPLYWNVWS